MNTLHPIPGTYNCKMMKRTDIFPLSFPLVCNFSRTESLSLISVPFRTVVSKLATHQNCLGMLAKNVFPRLAPVILILWSRVRDLKLEFKAAQRVKIRGEDKV